ncbi:VENN motif pre-toxin domain-containing protein [Zophobihabitans entericus]|uniref:VENN motif-containing domain-containing protein n=1 Tax=Zophobihabitans entericus TaxID=1635327 RepID=A0A6G9IE01_9GAMM|nr:VENN motif pre-toxin domain-containing protein [Zophobihabitans entericus]QIQ22039.1 hypothetical protein IPMB12_10290 [Zophobihabitans entericus]
MIASEAEDKSNNILDTGTISFSNIENKADYEVTHDSISVGTGGFGAGAPTTYENSDSASSTTHSAVEEGTLIVRDEDKQKQDVNELSRDTDNANNSLEQIFDKQKELDRMETLELVKDIGAMAKESLSKVDMASALSDYNQLSDDEKESINFDDYYKNRQKEGETIGGMGSSANKAIDSVISIVTGLITGDVTGGLAGASAPWLAEQIKKATTTYGSDGKPVVDMEANLLAHTILGAVVAELQGNSGLAGGAGALTGEAAAALIIKELYGNRDVSDLSEAEKQNISSLAQLAAGLAAAAGSGGDVGDIGTAVAGSKNATENNFLDKIVHPSTADNLGSYVHNVPAIEYKYIDKNGIEQADIYIPLNNEDTIKGLNDAIKGTGMQNGSDYALKWGTETPVIAATSLVSGPGGTYLVATVVGGVTNIVYQISTKPLDKFDITDTVISTAVSALSKGKGIWVSTGVGGLGGYVNSSIKGDNTVSGTLSGAASSAGGKVIGDITGPVGGAITSEFINNQIQEALSQYE